MKSFGAPPAKERFQFVWHGWAEWRKAGYLGITGSLGPWPAKGSYVTQKPVADMRPGAVCYAQKDLCGTIYRWRFLIGPLEIRRWA